MKRAFLVLIVLSIAACAQSPLYPDYCNQAPPYYYGPPTYMDFKLNTYAPGKDARHTLTFDITECHLETYLVEITYPSQFTWNGFLALGASGTTVGTYNLDIHIPDGIIDYTIGVYSLDDDTAWVDRFAWDGAYNPSIDPTIEYTSPDSIHRLTVTVPDGGDGRSDTVEGPFTERLIAIMFPGLFTNPASAGQYSVTADFTSVDPDTDNADDSNGYDPQTLHYSEDLEIRFATNPGVLLELLKDF